MRSSPRVQPVPNCGGNLQQFDHHSPAACTFSTSAPSPQAASLVEVRVFRTVCGTQWSIRLSGVAGILSGLIGKIVLPKRSTDFPPGSVPTRPDCVRWPEGQDPLEQWRQHFMSVGARSSSPFDQSFHADVMRRFADLCALLPVPRFFDSPFTTSELRCALSRCVESAVGLDGLPCSLFKRMFPWWQSALVKLFNLVLAWGAIPS